MMGGAGTKYYSILEQLCDLELSALLLLLRIDIKCELVLTSMVSYLHVTMEIKYTGHNYYVYTSLCFHCSFVFLL